MKKIVAKSVNRKMFMNLVKQMLIVDSYVTFRIDNECTDGISYLPMHDVVKNITIRNDELFGEIENLEKPIRVSYTDGTKLLNMFKNYKDSDEIDLVISCEDDENSEEMYALKLETITSRLKRQEQCADRKFSEAHITPLPADVVSNLFSTENSEFLFEISVEDMSQIKSLITNDKFIKKFIYTVKNGSLNITERPDIEIRDVYGYDIKIADVEGVRDCELVCNKNVFQVMSLADFKVYVSQEDGKLVYEHEDSEGRIRLVAVIVTTPEETDGEEW